MDFQPYILLFLSGSVSTLIVNKLFDLWTDHKQQKRELDRMRYAAKLKTSQEAMAFYFAYSNRIAYAKGLYQSEKPLSEFYSFRTKLTEKLSCYCKECHTGIVKKYRDQGKMKWRK